MSKIVSKSNDMVGLQIKDHDDIRALWDYILDGFLTRFEARNVEELKHVIEEVSLLLRAVRGKYCSWNSVIDVALFLLRRDGSVRTLKETLPYSESSIYRALNRLENIKFIRCMTIESQKVWAINKENFPLLYKASRLQVLRSQIR